MLYLIDFLLSHVRQDELHSIMNAGTHTTVVYPL
uniref:Uncharacterized protein n=1 Tax=Anguilla anguilla TaxID=7936 RepID=A0A0E9R207_ANGAN